MKLFRLNASPYYPCFVLKTKELTIMLDCSLDVSPLLNFLPLPLVHSPLLSSLPTFGKGNKENSSDFKKYIGKDLSMFKENIGQVLFDAQLECRLPEVCLVDFATVDVILLSNPHNMLALPYITEVLGFAGIIYATVPTVHLGRQLLEELTEYTHGVINIQLGHKPAQCQDWKELVSILPSGSLVDVSDIRKWRKLFTSDMVQSCVTKIRHVAFGEKLDLYGAVEAEALSSGYTLGSCNWSLRSNGVKLTYVSTSSLLTTHAAPIDRHKLLDSDLMIISSLSSAPSANPDSMLSELCSKMGLILHSGGNVLLPCYPGGILYDLLECIIGFLDNQGLSHIPVYYVSPVAKSSLAYANIYAEWLCDTKQSRTFLPEPPFLHEDFVKSGRLKIFSNIYDGDFSSSFKSPCIVFTGHPSLRCGPAVHLMEAWRSSSKNAVFITEPGLDHCNALLPYQPLTMKAFYFPVDPRLNFMTANKLIKEAIPKSVVVPEEYLKVHPDRSDSEDSVLKPPMPCYSIVGGLPLELNTPQPIHNIAISSEVAGLISMRPLSSGAQISSFNAVIETKSTQHEAKPLVGGGQKAGHSLWGFPITRDIVAELNVSDCMTICTSSQELVCL
jgi:integrator complex subunit 9